MRGSLDFLGDFWNFSIKISQRHCRFGTKKCQNENCKFNVIQKRLILVCNGAVCCQTVSRPRYTRTMCPRPLASFRGKAVRLHPQLRRYRTTTDILTKVYRTLRDNSREQKNQQGTHDILPGIYLKIVFYPFSKDIFSSRQDITFQVKTWN